ncbi:hypothetical protein ACM66B_005100 [Microbotryomycetes sp. NB124-2]
MLASSSTDYLAPSTPLEPTSSGHRFKPALSLGTSKQPVKRQNSNTSFDDPVPIVSPTYELGSPLERVLTRQDTFDQSAVNDDCSVQETWTSRFEGDRPMQSPRYGFGEPLCRCLTRTDDDELAQKLLATGQRTRPPTSRWRRGTTRSRKLAFSLAGFDGCWTILRAWLS